MTINQHLMNVTEFAEALGVTVACIRRWILERRITTIKVGRLVRIPEGEVVRVVEAGLRPALATAKKWPGRSPIQ